MPKKTAKQTKKRRADSPPEQSGLIAKGKSSQQSARTECALDNRSHRTTLRISCERTPDQPMDKWFINDGTMRTNLPFPQRSTVFMRLLDSASLS